MLPTGPEATPGVVTWDELLRALGVESRVVTEYVELGFAVPSGGPGHRAFTVTQAERLARALRLARDLELHAAGAVMLVELLEEREALLRRVRNLERVAGWSG